MIGYIAITCLIAGTVFGFMLCALFSANGDDEE